MATDIPKTFGALLLGGLFASVCVVSISHVFVLSSHIIPSLSGVVIVQTILYFKLFVTDPNRVKGLVRRFLSHCS